MIRAVALGLVTLAAGGVAQAFSISQTNGHDIKWGTSSLTYWPDTNGAPGVGAATIDAVNASAATWNAVACTSLHLGEAGTVTGVEPFLVSSKQDGKNVVTWVTTSAWTLGSRTLAVTTPVYSVSTGTIVEADIALNGYDVQWTTTIPLTKSGVADVQSVVTHEMGHLFGLQHVLGGENISPPPVMAPYLDPNGSTRVPKQDDINGVCYLYPKATYACSTIDDCPYILASDGGTEVYTGRLDCQGAKCGGIVGVSSTPGSLGSLCQGATDCNTGLDCTAFAGTSNCTQACTPSSSTACPTTFDCVSLSGTATGACFPAAVTGNCACDTGPGCQASCVCDPDCAKCACDVSTSCDSGCSCDPDCKGGCSAEPARDGSSRNGIGAALLFAAFVFLFARAKRPRHGGARSADV